MDKEQEISQKEIDHAKELEDFRKQTEEERLRAIQEAKDRQVEVAVDCPLDREYVKELLD